MCPKKILILISSIVPIILITSFNTFHKPDEYKLPSGYLENWAKAPVVYKKTYYVDQNHQNASDSNIGTEEQPFLSISKAIELVQAGERVLVKSGLYRESIHLNTGGTDANNMIVMEGEGYPVISGADVLNKKWSKIRKSPYMAAVNNFIWRVSLDKKDQIYSTLSLTNVTKERLPRLLNNHIRWKPEELRILGECRTKIYLDGALVQEKTSYQELSIANQPSYWFNSKSGDLYLFSKSDPNNALIEYTKRENLLTARSFKASYVKVSGFHFTNVANPFPFPQVGAIEPGLNHHWIIEDNRISKINGIGIVLGFDYGERFLPGVNIGYHIVKKNNISQCGIIGISGIPLRNTLIEDNYFEDNSYFSVEPMFESAAIKTHINENSIIVGNTIVNTKNGPGIWMDYLNKNSRCTKNVIINSNTSFGSIFMELSKNLNWVDNNIIIGSSASGVYQHDCDSLVISNNLITNCKEYGIEIRRTKNRKLRGKVTTTNDNVIDNNHILNCSNFLRNIGSNKIYLDSLSTNKNEYIKYSKIDHAVTYKVSKPNLHVKEIPVLLKKKDSIQLSKQPSN